MESDGDLLDQQEEDRVNENLLDKKNVKKVNIYDDNEEEREKNQDTNNGTRKKRSRFRKFCSSTTVN